MLLPTLIGASALLSAVVEAVPQANQADTRPQLQRAFRPIFGRSLNRTAYRPNFSNASTSATFQPKTETVALWGDEASATIECPTASIIVSTTTTTVDVTVYVTATSNMSYTVPPAYRNSGSAPLTKLGDALYLNTSTRSDTKTARLSGEYKPATMVEQKAAETPCTTDKAPFPINGTITTARSFATPVTRVQTRRLAAETPCTTNKPFFPANATSATPVRTPGFKFQTTTLSAHSSHTTPCNGTSTVKLLPVYTPLAKNLTTPHAKVASATTPCNGTISSTPTSHSSVVYTLPFANVTTPGVKVVTTMSSTPAAYAPAAYSLPVANATTPHVKVATATPSAPARYAPVVYNIPVANATTPHNRVVASTSSTPTGYASIAYGTPVVNVTTPRVKTTASASSTPASKSSMFYALPVVNATTPPAKFIAPTTSTFSSSMTSSTPCASNTTTPAISLYATPTLPSGNKVIISLHSTPTPPARTFNVTPFLSATGTPTSTTTSETCIIDASITPVSSAAFNYTRTYVPAPKTTICQDTVEDGAPRRNAAYCDVRGKPASLYFIAEYAQERRGVAVSLEGCYQLCNSTAAATRGCQAYRYFASESSEPRCYLYGMPVSRSAYELDSTQPSVWYDLTCGSPRAEAWRSDSHTDTASAGALLDLDLEIHI